MGDRQNYNGCGKWRRWGGEMQRNTLIEFILYSNSATKPHTCIHINLYNYRKD